MTTQKGLSAKNQLFIDMINYGMLIQAAKDGEPLDADQKKSHSRVSDQGSLDENFNSASSRKNERIKKESLNTSATSQPAIAKIV